MTSVSLHGLPSSSPFDINCISSQLARSSAHLPSHSELYLYNQLCTHPFAFVACSAHSLIHIHSALSFSAADTSQPIPYRITGSLPGPVRAQARLIGRLHHIFVAQVSTTTVHRIFAWSLCCQFTEDLQGLRVRWGSPCSNSRFRSHGTCGAYIK